MTVEDLVCERLAATSGVTALVGTRIYQLVLPQKPTLPAVRVQLIDDPSAYHLRGESKVTKARVQVDAYAGKASSADPKAVADAVADAVHTALSGQRFGSVGSPVELRVLGAFKDDRRTMYEPDEIEQVRVQQDYMVVSRRM